MDDFSLPRWGLYWNVIDHLASSSLSSFSFVYARLLATWDGQHIPPVDFVGLFRFPAKFFFPILGHQTLDPDPGSGSAIRKNAGSGSVSGPALNQCGSKTLLRQYKSLKKEHPSLTVSLTYPHALPRSGACALRCGRGAAAPGFPGPRGGRPSPGRRHQARPSLLDARRHEGQQVRSHKEICFLESALWNRNYFFGSGSDFWKVMVPVPFLIFFTFLFSKQF